MYKGKSIHVDKRNIKVPKRFMKLYKYISNGIDDFYGYFTYEVNGIYYIRDKESKKILHKYNEKQYEEFVERLCEE